MFLQSLAYPYVMYLKDMLLPMVMVTVHSVLMINYQSYVFSIYSKALNSPLYIRIDRFLWTFRIHWAYCIYNDSKNKRNNKWYPDGTFGPENLVTRAEIAVMVTKRKRLGIFGSGIHHSLMYINSWDIRLLWPLERKVIIKG